jgi:REJ domain
MNSHTSILSVPANSMIANVVYVFTVAVKAADGRSALNSVTVVPQLQNSAELSITSTFQNFNVESKLLVQAFILAPYATSSEWSVFTPHGVPVPFTSLTPKRKSFPITDANSRITYPLSIAGNTFVSGNAYVFRLSINPTDNSGMVTYAEITLTANAPPSGGYVASSPTVGLALETAFMITSSGWTTGVDSYPLSFSFSYSLSDSGAGMTLAASSVRAFVDSTLPAGLSSERNRVRLSSVVSDIFDSSATVATVVTVNANPSLVLSEVLESGLSAAFSEGNIDHALQVVNNVCVIVHLRTYCLLHLIFLVPYLNQYDRNWNLKKFT